MRGDRSEEHAPSLVQEPAAKILEGGHRLLRVDGVDGRDKCLAHPFVRDHGGMVTWEPKLEALSYGEDVAQPLGGVRAVGRVGWSFAQQAEVGGAACQQDRGVVDKVAELVAMMGDLVALESSGVRLTGQHGSDGRP